MSWKGYFVFAGSEIINAERTEVKLDDEEYVVVRQSDILAIVE